MNLNESLRNLISKMEDIAKPTLTEAKGHLDHPEDLVLLQGSAGAKKALKAMVDTVTNPELVTIKWDGSPALIFGVGTNGKFIIVDKHMMNKTGGRGRQIFSPEDFIKYEQARGATRTGLERIIPLLWPNLLKAYSGTGYYWGDLIFSNVLKPEKDGLYHFRANPKGISYTVEPNSDVGKLMTGKIAGIAIHQYMDPDAPEKAEQLSIDTNEPVVPTDLAKSLNGTLGSLKNNSDVALVPAKMPNPPKLILNNKLLNTAKNSIASNGPGMDKFLRDSPKIKKRGGGLGESPLPGLLTMYINAKVVAGNLKNLTANFIPFVADRYKMGKLSQQMADELLGYEDPDTNEFVPGYLEMHLDGLEDVFQVWIDIYNFKMSIVPQLDKAAETAPVQGYLQDGTRSQEGFVSHGVKFINRLGFSAQNLGGPR